MPNPDLASNASPLFCAPVMVTLVNTVSVTGCSGLPPVYLVWNMMPEYVGSTMSTSDTRMPRNSFEAEKHQMAPKVCAPQKWPPARISDTLSNRVGGDAPNPMNGKPKSSELMVT